ncbi:MAG: NAD(P)-dependent oxidoreductase [Pseudomonadota bacterium]
MLCPSVRLGLGTRWDRTEYSMERVGVVGLGRMGSAMAERLASQDVPVTGWTRSGRSVDGVPSAPDLAALVATSDTLILSLYDDTAVAEVLDALLALDLTGKLIIETSTVVPNLLQDRADALDAKEASAVDAPISGGPEMVLEGSCGIFIGGTDADVARARTALTLITERIAHVGPLGAGLVMKTINNSMLQAYVTGLRELLPMAKRAGISLEQTLGILNAGPAGIPMVATRIDKILGKDPSVGFTMAGVHKDNDVFRRIVAAHNLPSPILDFAAEMQREAIADGFGDKDPALVIAAAYDKG